METTDIDKKIGMPDVDAEWARFEREVIGEETQPKKHSLALWAWGIGIAASIAVVAGLFLFGNRSKGKNEGSVAMAEENKSEVHEEKDANDGNAENFQLQPDFQAKTSESEKQDPLQGHIAGLDLDDKPFHFVKETDRSALPHLWERDTVLTLVNGKEDSDFLRYLSGMSHWSMSNVFDYFFERNQLFLMQSLPSKEVQVARYDPSLFEGRDIRLVVDYLTKPFTPVSQLTQEQINSRRLAYLQNKYRAGFCKNSTPEYISPDLYDTPAEERLFGLTAAKCRSNEQEHEYFGPIGSDNHGIYVPLIRDVVLTTNDDAWWKNGEVWILKDDPCFNQVVIDIRQAATCAESSVVTNGDSIVRLAFIFGGKVIEEQPNDLISGMQKQLYEKIKESTFEFKPNVDTPSWWWGEAYYSTASQRHLWMHLHSVDKLYAVDCPELLSNRRHVEGIVTDEKGEPLAEACIGIGFVTPWDAITTDSNGHFDLWMPFRDAAIRVNHMGYVPHVVHPTDTALVIHMKDATKLREVNVPTKEEINEIQRLTRNTP